MTSRVTIEWKAFGDFVEEGSQTRLMSGVNIELPTVTDHEALCEEIYANTNLYAGRIWEIIEPLMSPVRTHTSLSVGDEITIDGTTYRVASFGFDKVCEVTQ